MLHASLILSGVKPSRRQEDSTCYGTNNTSNAEIWTGFDLLQNAKGFILSSKFTKDDFDRRLDEKKERNFQSRCDLRKLVRIKIRAAN